MKNKINRFIYTAFLATTLVGCSDFFEVTDKGSISPDIFPTTLDQVDLMLNASYAGSHTKGLYTFYWFPMGVYLYDNTSNTDATYDSRANQMSNNTDTDCEYNAQTYCDVLRWIELSNAALEGIADYREHYAVENEAAALDFMKGQALFNRALAYWHGQIFFEIESKKDGLGLPLIDKVPKALDEMMPQRATTEQTWDFVIETLKDAISLLKGHNSDPTRATEWAAKGLLAKVYMQARRPAEAKPILEDIINNSGKKLVPYSVYSNMFYADEAYEFNEEFLYEIDMTMNDKQNGPWGGFTTGSGMPMVFAPWPLNLDFRDRPSTTEYDIITNSTGGWGNNYVHDKNVHRFGFGLGAPGNRIKNPDFKSSDPRSITNLPYIIDPAYYQRSLEIRQNKEADPRLYISAGQPYVDTMKDSKGKVTFYDKSPGMNNQPGILSWNHKKFTNREGFENQLNFSSPANYPIVRLADIYLLYAEVLKDSDSSTALEYINKIHRRAYDYPIDQPSPIDYTSLTDRTKAEPDDHLANDPLKYERWAELFAEGQWWFDIRRWEIGEQEMKYFKENRNGSLIWRGIDCYVQPIPKTEIERYNGNIKQSGNY